MDRFFTLGRTSNFRHMGGYDTASGRRTRSDRLYRSGYVNAPGAEVAAMFDRLGIATVYDFRSPVERVKHPLEVTDQVEVVELGMLVASVENLWDMLLAEGLTPAGAEKIMAERYRELTREEVPGYRTMFQHLTAGDGGALVMCSFGKDRAGIASALLLHALGVPAAQVEADYLLSSTAYADEDAAIGKFEQFFNAPLLFIPDQFEHRVGVECLLNLLMEIEGRKLQKTNRLLQLRGHGQALTQLELKRRFHVRARDRG